MDFIRCSCSERSGNTHDPRGLYRCNDCGLIIPPSLTAEDIAAVDFALAASDEEMAKWPTLAELLEQS